MSEAVTEEEAPQAVAPTPQKMNVEIYLINGINVGGKITKAILPGDADEVNQDVFGVSVKAPTGNITWIPNSNIAGIITSPKE